jgi:hypothetical protein
MGSKPAAPPCGQRRRNNAASPNADVADASMTGSQGLTLNNCCVISLTAPLAARMPIVKPMATRENVPLSTMRKALSRSAPSAPCRHRSHPCAAPPCRPSRRTGQPPKAPDHLPTTAPRWESMSRSSGPGLSGVLSFGEDGHGSSPAEPGLRVCELLSSGVVCGRKAPKSICQQASPGFLRLRSRQALRLRTIKPSVCDRSAKRFAPSKNISKKRHPHRDLSAPLPRISCRSWLRWRTVCAFP